MIDRQRKYWKTKFVEEEKRMLEYFQPKPLRPNPETPDGSFLFHAFARGYEVGIRERQKKAKGK